MGRGNGERLRARGRTATVVAAVLAAPMGCGVHMSVFDRVRDPLTPEQSRAQVLEAAREIVTVLNLPVVRAGFWHAACNDLGKAPFRGQMLISYPRAADDERSDAEVDAMITRLRAHGWTADPGFHSHSPVVTKNNVTVIFQRQNASVPTRGIEVLGECRNITTRSQNDDGSEWVSLG